MATNAFNPSTMPSARAARIRQWRMLGALPLYVLIVLVISAAILAIVAYA